MNKNTKKIVTGVVSAVASAVVSMWITKMLKDKPLSERAYDTKMAAADLIDYAAAQLRKFR